jgi:hypothetical protein
MAEVTIQHPFSLTHGGPFYRLMARAHAVRSDGRIRATPLVLVLWAPLVVGALVRLALGHGWDPLITEPAVHARLLVGLPLLITGERMLDSRCALVGDVLRNSDIAERATLNRIFERAERLRDARNVEALLALLVLLATQAALWGITNPGLAPHAQPLTSSSFVTLWYVGIALPVFQFLLMRWVWQWIVWIYVLARIARSSLSLNGLHPDRTCGLKFVLAPIDAFAFLVSAISVVAAASWLMPILNGKPLQSFVPTFIIFVVTAIVVAWGPLLLFSRQIYNTRSQTYAAYTAFAHEYVADFRMRWLNPERHKSEVLGTADLQSLADLGNSFAAPDETRILPLSGRVLVTLVVAALWPMLPLVIVVIPFSQLLAHLGKALLGPFA